MKGEKTMKTKEELDALKIELEGLKEKLSELTEEELMAVTGGTNDTNTEVDREVIGR